MFKTALTSHAEMWLYFAVASVGLVHHSPNARVRLFLSRKAAPGWNGGDGGDGGGGGGSGGGGEGGIAGGDRGVLHQAEAQSYLHAEGAWTSKLAWMSNWLQPLKALP